MSHEFAHINAINRLMNTTYNLLDLLAMLDIETALVPSEYAVEKFVNKRYFSW